jgi:hypothetical protein
LSADSAEADGTGNLTRRMREMLNGRGDNCDSDALEGMVRNVELALGLALTQLGQLKKALKDPKIIENRREKIKTKFMSKISEALEQLRELEDGKAPSDD